MFFDPIDRVGVVLLTNTDSVKTDAAFADGLLGQLFDAARQLHARRR